MGCEVRGPRARRIGQPLVEVAFEDFGESGRIGIHRIEDRIVQILHPLPEGEDLLPLLQSLDRFRRICRYSVQLVHLEEEPFDFWKSRCFVALHRPVKFFLRPRFRLATWRPKPLAHDPDNQCQRLPVLLQRLPRDQILGPSNTDGRVVLPVHHLKPDPPNMSSVAVVFIEELAHILPLRPHITGRGKKHMICIN